MSSDAQRRASGAIISAHIRSLPSPEPELLGLGSWQGELAPLLYNYCRWPQKRLGFQESSAGVSEAEKRPVSMLQIRAKTHIF